MPESLPKRISQIRPPFVEQLPPLVLLDYLDRTNEDDRDYDHHDNGDGRDSYPRRLQ